MGKSFPSITYTSWRTPFPFIFISTFASNALFLFNLLTYLLAFSTGEKWKPAKMRKFEYKSNNKDVLISLAKELMATARW